TSPFAVNLAYAGARDLSAPVALGMARDSARADAEARLFEIPGWMDASATGSPLPPLRAAPPHAASRSRAAYWKASRSPSNRTLRHDRGNIRRLRSAAAGLVRPPRPPRPALAAPAHALPRL